MRKHWIVLIFNISILGCTEWNTSVAKVESIEFISEEILIVPDTIYTVEEAYKLWEAYGELTSVVVDTVCINQLKKAERDITNGQLYFPDSFYKMESEELRLLFCEFDVRYVEFLRVCFAPPPGFKSYCYENEMWRAVYKKLGEKTIDSLRVLAERNWLLKYPDSIYLKDGIEIRASDI